MSYGSTVKSRFGLHVHRCPDWEPNHVSHLVSHLHNKSKASHNHSSQVRGDGAMSHLSEINLRVRSMTCFITGFSPVLSAVIFYTR